MATKKGKRDGTTAVAHKINPFLAANKLLLENITKQIANKPNIIVIKFFLNE